MAEPVAILPAAPGAPRALTSDALGMGLDVRALDRPVAVAAEAEAGHLAYLQALRALAAVFVLAGHALNICDWRESPLIGAVLRAVLTNATTYFVFIAGFVMQTASLRHGYGEYLWKRWRYVMMPFLIMSLPTALWFTFVASPRVSLPAFAHQSTFCLFLAQYVGGDVLNCFWFLYLIGFYYLLFPLFVWWDRHPRLYGLLLPLLMLGILVPRGALLASCVHFLPVYLLGMWLSRNRDYAFGVVRATLPLWVIAVVACVAIEVATNDPTWNYLQKLLLCPVLCLWFRREQSGKDGIVRQLAWMSYSIYLVQGYSLWTLRHLAREMVQDASKVLGDLPMYCVVLAVSLILTVGPLVLLRRLLGRHSRMIIGC